MNFLQTFARFFIRKSFINDVLQWNIYEIPHREKCLYAEFFWSLFSRIRTDTLISNHLLGEKYPDSEFSVPYFPAFGLYTEI